MNLVDYDLKNAIKQELLKHHQSYELPVISEYWENLFANAVRTVEGYSDWTPNRSHAVGKDQKCTIYGQTFRVSNKSGKYNQIKQTLQISGSRTGKYKTIEEKIKFLSDKQEDVYACLATNTNKRITNEYYIFTFDTNLLNYSDAEWQPKYDKEGNQNGWQCETDHYFATIRNSMSDQLWTTIKLQATNIEPEVIKIDTITSRQLSGHNAND